MGYPRRRPKRLPRKLLQLRRHLLLPIQHGLANRYGGICARRFLAKATRLNRPIEVVIRDHMQNSFDIKIRTFIFRFTNAVAAEREQSQP